VIWTLRAHQAASLWRYTGGGADDGSDVARHAVAAGASRAPPRVDARYQPVGAQMGGQRSSGASLQDLKTSPHIFERGTDMKCILILSILAALLAGCAVVPAGYGDRERGYNRGEDNYRDRDFNDGNFRHYSFRGEHGNQGDT
jgi:hypothetical protein